jgi:TRAP transporter TAXI family solute receptor
MIQQRRFQWAISAFVTIIIVLALTACSVSQSGSESNQQDSQEDNNTSNKLSTNLSAGSSSIGGLYHIWMSGWATTVGEALESVINVQSTPGAAQNVRMVSEKQIDVGLATMGTLYAGLQGTGWTDGTKYDNVQVLFPVYQSYIQAWTLTEEGMTNWRDLDDKVFSPGTAGGTAEVESPSIFKLLGVTPADKVLAGYEDANGMLKDKLVDAVAASTGVPSTSVVSLSSTHDITVLEFSPEDIEKIVSEMPYFSPGTIQAGTYKDQNEDINTLALWNVVIANKDMPDDVAYQLVKTTFEKHDELLETHPASKDTLAENIKYINAPIHPGAARYYEEIGIQLQNN